MCLVFAVLFLSYLLNLVKCLQQSVSFITMQWIRCPGNFAPWFIIQPTVYRAILALANAIVVLGESIVWALAYYRDLGRFFAVIRRVLLRAEVQIVLFVYRLDSICWRVHWDIGLRDRVQVWSRWRLKGSRRIALVIQLAVCGYLSICIAATGCLLWCDWKGVFRRAYRQHHWFGKFAMVSGGRSIVGHFGRFKTGQSWRLRGRRDRCSL